MSALALRSIVAGYGAATVLRSISLDVAVGTIVALVGANGAGKSTLLRCISGLVWHSSGEIALDNVSIGNRSASQRVRAGIAHVPEGRQVFADLSVTENLEMGAYARRLGVSEFARRVVDVEALFPVLRDRRALPAGQLSGGQQQMLAIARGLVANPRVLLLDEPSLGLSPLLTLEIFRALVVLRARGATILVAEQNARMALAIADRGYVLENGVVAAEGSGSELLASPAIVERYLGVAGEEARVDADATAKLSATLRAALGE